MSIFDDREPNLNLPLQNLTADMEHETVFRDHWLPAIGVDASAWAEVAPSIMRGLHERVWMFGPCVGDWDQWVARLKWRYENILEPDQDLLTKDFLDTYRGQAMRDGPRSILEDSFYLNSPDWLDLLRDDPYGELNELATWISRQPSVTYDKLEIASALFSMRQLILLRYLPVKPGSPSHNLYRSLLNMHNGFSRRWKLPQLHPTDMPKP